MMAKFNELLAGRFNRALQKLLSMKGGPPAAQLATEITPNLQFNSMGADFRYLEGWNRFANAPPAIAAAAGNNAECRMTMDYLSNGNVVGVYSTIAVLEKLWVFSSLADEIDLTLAHLVPKVSGHVPDLTINPSIVMDSRTFKNQNLGGSSLHVSTSTISNTRNEVIARFQIPANGTIEIILHEDHQITLTDGDLFQVQTSVVTNTIRVVAWWRERVLEDSEQ